MSRKVLANDVSRIADIMRRDDGTNGVNEYIEQISWMFFLKVFEDLERRFEAEHQLSGEKYATLIPKGYSWSTWTRKSTKDIIDFIDIKLFPFLGDLTGSPEKNTMGLIFSEVKRNKMKSASNLKDVIDIINEIDFNNPEDSHVLSQFYEELLVKLGRESGYAGEFYTPRPIVRLMVAMIDPKLNTDSDQRIRILDPFCGSCGFLIESYKHIMRDQNITVTDYLQLQREVFHGFEKKSLPYLVGLMNCILHGLLTPNIVRKNSLNENIVNFGLEDKFDYVLTNPPFGGTENKQIQQNFPVKVQTTQLLALQHVMKRLKPNGKCGIVVPESVLSATDNAYLRIKKELLENFNLNSVISLPQGVFANVTASGPGPKTCLLFFDKTRKTENIWYYKLNEPKPGYSKANSVRDEDLVDCYSKWGMKDVSENSWLIPAKKIIDNNYNLIPRELMARETRVRRSPKDLIRELELKGENMKLDACVKLSV
jgi:type I restriction enzyme M protein